MIGTKLTHSPSEYLSCEKGNISTTTLVGSGIGVTVAIFGLVFLGIWWVQRGWRRGSKTEETPPSQVEQGSRSEFPAFTPTELPRGEKQVYIPPAEKRYPPQKREKLPLRDPRAARVDMTDEFEEDRFFPQQPTGHVGSPLDPNGLPVRKLFPSNPSPDPRHLQSQNALQSSITSRPVQQPSVSAAIPHIPPSTLRQAAPASAMRQSAYTAQARRDSISSVHFAGAAVTSTPPPMPDPALLPRQSSPQGRPITGTTQPLALRKSSAVSMAIPSYYESTGRSDHVEPNGPSSSSRKSLYKQSIYSASSNEGSPPPLPPYDSRPLTSPMEVRPNIPIAEMSVTSAGQRRPSAGGRKGSEDKGGMF